MGPSIPLTQCSGVRGSVPFRSIRVSEGSSVNASLDCQRLRKVCTSSIFLGPILIGLSLALHIRCVKLGGEMYLSGK